MRHRNLMIEALELALAQNVEAYVLPDVVARQAAFLAGCHSD